MDKIQKALKRLTEKERAITKTIIRQIKSQKLDGLDIKKLTGFDAIFRVRKGSLRIVYQITEKGTQILTIERRNENTYKL